MDRYQRMEKPKADTPIDENEIRITSQGRMPSYITYAMTLLQDALTRRLALLLQKDPTRSASCSCSKIQARDRKNYDKADELHKKIIDLGYRVIQVQNQEVLARKYRIRLRGIDTLESKMDYGQRAKEELINVVQGKCLRVLAFDEDCYSRFVADVYCNDIFVQEAMLKKGLEWHYKAYDQRPELDKVGWPRRTI